MADKIRKFQEVKTRAELSQPASSIFLALEEREKVVAPTGEGNTGDTLNVITKESPVLLAAGKQSRRTQHHRILAATRVTKEVLGAKVAAKKMSHTARHHIASKPPRWLRQNLAR